jgi:hypothetical protein
MAEIDVLELTKRFTHSTTERVFRAHFGGPSIAINVLARKILRKCELPCHWNLDHLFMCLFFLKCPFPSLEVISSRFNVSPKTFERHLWESLTLIDEALPDVIIFSLF